MSIETPLSPYSQEAEDQFPFAPDIETDAGYLAEKLLASKSSPSPEDIDNAIYEAERILAQAAEAEYELAEIARMTELLKDAVYFQKKRNSDQALVNKWDRSYDSSRRSDQDFIEKFISKRPGNTWGKKVDNAKEMIRDMRDKVVELDLKAREAFQMAYLGKTLRQIDDEVANGSGDPEAADLLRMEVQRQHELFQEKLRSLYSGGKEVPDDEYVTCAIALMQRREDFLGNLL